MAASLQQSLHALAASLSQAYPDGQPSPYPAVPPPSRQAFRATMGEAKDAVGRFRPVWDGAPGDEAKVKASGSMREWATNTSVLALLPSLTQLSAVTASCSRTPFALPLSTPLPTLLETRAKRLGLEVYRETLLDDDDPSGAGGAKDVLVLGGKVLVLELELLATSPPAASTADETEVTAVEQQDVVRWSLVKCATSLSIPGAADPLPVPALDAFLRPPLDALLALSAPRNAPAGAAGETPELTAGRQLALWESRIGQVLALEGVFAARPGVIEDGAHLRDALRLPEAGSVGSADALFPTVPLSATHSLAFLPSLIDPAAPTPARLPLSASSAAPATPPFLWEATFTPPLALPLPSFSPSLPPSSATSSPGVLKHAEGFWAPPPGRAGRAQRWTLDSPSALDRVEVARVGLTSEDEARAVISWARDWVWVVDFADKVLDGTSPSAEGGGLTSFGEITLESLTALATGTTPVPISLELRSAAVQPQIALTLPHPTQPLAVQILISPLSASSTSSPAHGGAHIDLVPQELEQVVGRARLDVLGQKVGGEGRAVVLWLLKRLEECAQGAEGEDGRSGDGDEREAKRMKVD